MLQTGMRMGDDENFTEAIAAVMYACNEPTVSFIMKKIE
jgi:hypothetical protein